MYQDWMEKIPVLEDIEIKQDNIKNEQEHIKTLINLRKELKDGCKCNLLSEDDKKQWYKEIKALEWAFGELGIEV